MTRGQTIIAAAFFIGAATLFLQNVSGVTLHTQRMLSECKEINQVKECAIIAMPAHSGKSFIQFSL